jgi:hypothetical protein
MIFLIADYFLARHRDHVIIRPSCIFQGTHCAFSVFQLWVGREKIMLWIKDAKLTVGVFEEGK